jgi:cyclohexadieny/prephenate dehydrogenase
MSPGEPQQLFDKIAIIGLGLIGSSLARAIRKHGLAGRLAGFDASEAVRARARELGLADDIPDSAAEAAAQANLVIVCVPVRSSGDAARAIAPSLKLGAIVTDVGSVKASVVRDISPHLPEGVHLVPGHPIAGTEHSGPDAGFPELFEERWAILTPSADTDPAASERVAELWRRMGSRVAMMTPEHHDRVLGITSHLPHLIAFSIVGTAADLESSLQSEVIKYSAGGFRDFTRIAASDPIMWRDVFLSNREAVLELLGRFAEDLAVLQRAIRWGEGETLEALFTRARAIRRGVIEAKQARLEWQAEPPKVVGEKKGGSMKDEG